MSYRRFGTNYQSYFIGFLTPEDDTDRLSCKVDYKLPLLAKYCTRRAQFSSKETLESHKKGGQLFE